MDRPTDQKPPAVVLQAESKTGGTPQKSRHMSKDSLEDPEVDPWASPAVHKGHTHNVNNDATPNSDGVTAARPISGSQMAATRTTSTFTTQSEEPSSSIGDAAETSASAIPSTSVTSGGWGSYDNNSSGFPNGESPAAAGFGSGSGGDEPNNPSGRATIRALGGGRTTTRGVDETVTITMLPEKEGMFMFQHRNYEVKSARRASTVIRRYSDFVWLLDCLLKRYPFRQLPLLPPKRVAGKLISFPYLAPPSDHSRL